MSNADLSRLTLIRNKVGIYAFRALVHDICDGGNTRTLARMYGLTLWDVRLTSTWLPLAVTLAHPIRIYDGKSLAALTDEHRAAG